MNQPMLRSRSQLAFGVLFALTLFACAGVKKTAKDVGHDLNLREEVVGKPVDAKGNPVDESSEPGQRDEVSANPQKQQH